MNFLNGGRHVLESPWVVCRLAYTAPRTGHMRNKLCCTEHQDSYRSMPRRPARNEAATNSLEIQLTEPVIFLRKPERQHRRYAPQEGASQPSGALVRGVLTLTLAKEDQISSIEVELEGRAVTTWIETAGPTRTERSERYNVHSTSILLSKAVSGASSGVSPNQGRHVHSVLEFQRCGQSDGTREYSPHTVYPDFSTSELDYGAPQLRLVGYGHVGSDIGNIVDSGITASARGRRRSWHDTNEYHGGSHRHLADFDNGTQLYPEPAPSYTLHSNDVAYLVLDDSYFPSMGDGSTPLPQIEQIVPQRPNSDVRSILGDQLPSLRNPSDTGEENAIDLSYTSSTSTSRSSSSQRKDAHNACYDRRGRSFSNMVHLFDVIKKHAARSLSPLSHRGISMSRTHTASSDSSVHSRMPTSTASTKAKHISRIFRDTRDTLSCRTHDVVALSSSDTYSQNDAEAWITLQKGTYNYPILFTLPPDSPPTIRAEYGSFTWCINAKVKRPGTASQITRTMVAHKDVEVVCMPTDDPLEEPSENATTIQLQRAWDTQLEYRLDVFHRNNPLDGILPFQLTIIPLRKIKVHQVAVYLEERAEYFSRSGDCVRTRIIRHATLLQLQHTLHTYSLGDSQPILPLSSPDLSTFRASPLYRHRHPDDEHDAALSYAGFGPWVVKCDLHLPGAVQGFHPSTPTVNGANATERNLKSNIRFDHMLKVVMKVKRNDDGYCDGPGSQQKGIRDWKNLYEISVDVPIRVLSELCTPERITLPRYPCPSAESAERDACRSDISNDSYTLSASSPNLGMNGTVRDPEIGLYRLLSRPFNSVAFNSSDSTGRTSLDEISPTLYERLVSGLESETGEAPPAYSEDESR
ncbi:hypothetical protein V8B97DRAFT_442475 [Scleroderma yunnanense]